MSSGTLHSYQSVFKELEGFGSDLLALSSERLPFNAIFVIMEYGSTPYKVTKKHFKNERTYRDGIPKKQPNKVGMVPQYPYGLSSLYLLPFLQLVPSKAKLYSSSIDLFSL